MAKCIEQRQVVEFSIEQIDDMPESRVCTFCGGEAKKMPIEFGQPYRQENKKCIALSKLPGYKCETCGTETYYRPACIEAYKIVSEIVRSANDLSVLAMIEASLRALSD